MYPHMESQFFGYMLIVCGVIGITVALPQSGDAILPCRHRARARACLSTGHLDRPRFPYMLGQGMRVGWAWGLHCAPPSRLVLIDPYALHSFTSGGLFTFEVDFSQDPDSQDISVVFRRYPDGSTTGKELLGTVSSCNSAAPECFRVQAQQTSSFVGFRNSTNPLGLCSTALIVPFNPGTGIDFVSCRGLTTACPQNILLSDLLPNRL